MIKTLKTILTASIFTMLILPFVSCEKPVPIEEIVEIISLEASSVTMTSAQVHVKATDDITIHYAYFKSAQEPAEDEKMWLTQSVKDSIAIIQISELDPETAYKVEMYGMSASGKETERHSLTFNTEEVPLDPSISVENIESMATHNSAQVKVSTKDVEKFYYTYYFKDLRPEDEAQIKWVEIATTTGEEDNLVDLSNLTTSTTSDIMYTMEVYAVGGEKTTDPVMVDFYTKKIEMIAISDIEVGTFGASFKFDITLSKELGLCDGVIYKAYLTSRYAENKLSSDIQYGTVKRAYESGEYDLVDSYLLTPNTEYTLAYATAELDEEGKLTKIVGGVKTHEFTTAARQIDENSSAEASLTIPSEGITFNTINYTTHRSDDCVAYYIGSVSDTELAGKTVKDYILENDFLTKSSYKTFLEYSSEHKEYVLVESLDGTLKNLETSTSYNIFTVAISKSGTISKIHSVQVATAGLVFSDKYKLNLTVDPSYTTINVDVDIDTSLGAYYYITNDEKIMNDLTGELALEKLLLETTAGFPDKFTESKVYEVRRLKYNMDYKIYLLPIGNNGEFGEVQSFDFSTKKAEFNSSSTLSYTIVSSEFDQWDAETVKLDITFNGDVVGYYARPIEAYEIDSEITNPTPIDYAEAMFTNGDITSTSGYYYTTSGENTFTLWNTTDNLVLFPMDSNGNLGQPILYLYNNGRA